MNVVWLLVLGAFSYAGNGFAQGGDQATQWGGEFTLRESISVDSAIERHEAYENREILIEGETTKVCQVKGCWMVLKGTDSEIRVTFKDYEFFVPPNLVNKRVLAQGRLSVRTMGVAEAQHLAQDAGRPAEEISRIQQPVQEYRFIASAVKALP